MPKILADECVHRDLFLAIKKRGFDIISVKEAGLAGASDEEVFNFAVKTKRALFTFDRGFGDIFRFNISKSSGVIVFLVEDLAKDEMIDMALNFFVCIKKISIAGKLAIIDRNKIRLIQR